MEMNIRTISRIMLVMMLVSTLGIVSGLAPAYGHGDSGGQSCHRHGKWGSGGPLMLTKGQQKKMKAAFQAERPIITPLRRALRDAMIKLKDKVEDKASDSDIQIALKNVKAAKKALRAEKRNFRAKIAAILTPTQRAQALIFRMRRKMAFKRRYMGRFGKHGRGYWMRRGHGQGEGNSEDAPASQGQ